MRKFLRRFFRNPGAVLGLALLILLILVALLGPLVAGDPLEQNLLERLKPPGPGHPLGTDQLGRDVWARVVHGTRISLGVGFGVVLLASFLGVSVGLLAGGLGGVWDNLLMRLTDIFFAFPSLILAMAIAAALGPNLTNTVIAVALVTWPIYARLVRAQVLALREREFVEAARALGAGQGRILFRHLLPNALTPVLVQASYEVGAAILTAAGLSFIGFGAQPPTPEWGAMVAETRNYMAEAPWAATAPAVGILLTVLAFNLLGDGLRDVLDPRGH
ncbi:D-ala-D-ala transporter subunit [Thermus scotoductus]|uniref:D-ala-D-ala transporter subunit n=1 Tax=Thermus scotoductus TaxID=37636 RepID=A0A430SA12_THESC|nr:nickel transporter permease [Thermus scotoductus]RTH32748.1 D-ala-D-ala transporter subunit [Thermus scotoductus]RTH32755.1 D-ala-D-ala transporter subunit [Thermus scotoductus]